MRNRVETLHHIPGRIRLKIAEAKGDDARCAQVRRIVNSVDGVRHVKTSRITGSITINYDKDDGNFRQRLEKALQENDAFLSFIVPELSQAEKISELIKSDAELLRKRSRVADSLYTAIKRIDLTLKRATNNMIDLKLLLPLALAGYSLFTDRKRIPLVLLMLLLLVIHTFATLNQAQHHVYGKQVRFHGH
jgi:hypothetical protein